MREIEVLIKSGLDADGIKDALNERDKNGVDSALMFDVAHALLVNQTDDRAEIHAVVVDDVAIDPNYPSQIYLNFTASWSAYYGCKDMNMADDEHLGDTATYTVDGRLIFRVPERRRPASDC